MHLSQQTGNLPTAYGFCEEDIEQKSMQALKEQKDIGDSACCWTQLHPLRPSSLYTCQHYKGRKLTSLCM